jgi:hypothetical protein
MNGALRSPSQFSALAALVPTGLAALLAFCLAVGSAGSGLTSAAAPVPAVTVLGDGPQLGGGGRVVLRIGEGVATATLEDTPAAGELAAMLPLTLRLQDPMGQAKSGTLPTPLPLTDDERVTDPEAGGLYYWPPSGALAIFYEDLGQSVPSPGLVRLGSVDAGLDVVASAGNRFTLSIDRD